MFRRVLFSVCVLMAFPAAAEEYFVDYYASEVSFAGQHAGKDFHGVFEDWTAEVKFDPAHLSDSHVTAEFNLASAKTGDKIYDGTLPQEDWFNVKATPQGTFVSTSFEKKDDHLYQVTGDLTLRGITHPVSFEFSLSDLSTYPVEMTTTFPIDRLAYDIGKTSDPNEEWVNRNITLSVRLVAEPALGPAK